MSTQKFNIRMHAVMFIVALLISPMAMAQTTHMVTVSDNFFSPANLTIEPGDTVRWTNAAGGASHDVTSDTGAWTPSVTASSFTFEVTFDDPGSFDYRCSVHPASMRGNITVESAATAELELQSVDAADGTYKPDDSLTIDSVIRNTGDAASGSFTITYYASTDNTIDASDNLLGSEQIADVGAGATLNQQANVNVPGELPGGDYFIGAIITFSDTNAANNTNVDGTAVTFVGLFFVNAGLNDAWFNLATSGQGFFFVVFPDIELFFLSWFTFDTVRPDEDIIALLGEPGHRWLTAFGTWEGDTVTLIIELTSGGVFDSPEPPIDPQVEYGTITIVFHDCNNATLTYDIPSLELMGTIELTRLTLDNVALCEELNAALQNQ